MAVVNGGGQAFGASGSSCGTGFGCLRTHRERDDQAGPCTATPRDQPGGDEVSTLLTEIKLFPGDFEAACNGWGSGKVEQPAFGRLVRSRRWPAALRAIIGSA